MDAGILTAMKGAWSDGYTSAGNVRIYHPAAPQIMEGAAARKHHYDDPAVSAPAMVRTITGDPLRAVRSRDELLKQQRIRTAKGYYFARTAPAGRIRTVQGNGRSDSPRRHRPVLRYIVLAAGICITVTLASYWMIRLMKSVSLSLH